MKRDVVIVFNKELAVKIRKKLLMVPINIVGMKNMNMFSLAESLKSPTANQISLLLN